MFQHLLCFTVFSFLSFCFTWSNKQQVYFLTAHKYLQTVNNEQHCFKKVVKKKKKILSHIYTYSRRKFPLQSPHVGVSVLAQCLETKRQRGYVHIFSVIQLFVYFYIFMHVYESMTSCTFNTFPIHSGSWSLNQVLKSHQHGESRNLEQVRNLHREFLKYYTVISLFQSSIIKKWKVYVLKTKLLALLQHKLRFYSPQILTTKHQLKNTISQVNYTLCSTV